MFTTPPKKPTVIKFCLVSFIFLIVGCGNRIVNRQAETPPTTILATSTQIIPTPTLRPGFPLASSTISISANSTETPTPPGSQGLQIIDPLKHQKDYIIYSDQNPQDNQNEIWAIDPNDGSSILVMKGEGIWSAGWSPSGMYWLITGKHELFLADSDGTNIRQIFQDPSYVYFATAWLSDNNIFVNAYQDLLNSFPDMFEIDIQTGKITKLNPGENTFAIAVSAFAHSWIGYDGSKLLLIDQQQHISMLPGNIKPSFRAFSLDSLNFLPNSDQFIFESDHSLWLFTLSQRSNLVNFSSTKGIGQINYYLASPDGSMVGFTFTETNVLTPTFQVINKDSGKVVAQFSIPYTVSTLYFRWSPDSKFVVLPYQSTNPGSPVYPSDIDSGIQIMNTNTGEIKILLKKNVTITDWHYLEK